MTEPTLYRIVDEYPWLERHEEYSRLNLEEAAIRMDDLTGCGEDVILSDWDEPCEHCGGSNLIAIKNCDVCRGTGKWPGPWEWTDPETGREVTMMREVS